MVLLVMIVTGLMTMAGLESRSGRLDKHKKAAQANARMALMVALGELQINLGPDQRVTAEADILDASGFSGFDRAPSRKHYVGVYDTKGWTERDGSKLPGYWRSYEKNRNKDAFMGWLVSGKYEDLRELEYVKGEVSEEGFIEVLGEGSLGAGAAEEDKMYVPLVEVSDGSGVKGRYGWAALDQGVKANVALTKKREVEGSLKAYGARFNLMTQQAMGVKGVSGYENFENEGNHADLERLLTREQLDLVGAGELSQATVSRSYHDTTVYSQSVLCDVLRGGLKRDLSLPFELPDIKAENSASDWEYDLNREDSVDNRHTNYPSIWGFNNSGDQMSEFRHSRMIQSGYRPYWWAKKMGYLFSYPEGGGSTDHVGNQRYLRGPTWDLLRSHYRQYKGEFEDLAASDRERRGVESPNMERARLAQPYQPYSHQSDSFGNHLLSHAYVGETVSSGGGYRSDSLWDPFYVYDSAASGGNRPWNVMAFRTYGLAPVVTKFGAVLSVYTDQLGGRKRLNLCIDAIGTVWNPYNVPIETEAIFTQMKLEGLKWSLECKRAGGSTEQWASEPGKAGYAADRAFPFKHIRIGVANELGGNGRPGSNLLLMPGELRTFALDFPTPKGYSYGSLVTEPGKFTNNWNGGYYLRHSDKWLLDAGDKLTFILKPDDSKRSSFNTILGYFEQLNGAAYNPFDADTSDRLIDQPELSSVHVAKSSEMFDGNQFETTLSSFPVGADNKKAIAYIEFERPASDESTQGMATAIDPRSIVNHTKAMGGAGVPETWKAEIKQVSDFDLLQNGVGIRNNGFWGSSSDGSGETHVVYYDIPDVPLVSLGAFQSCQMGATGWSSPYAIGSSFPHPLLTQESLVKSETEDGFENVLYDLSYLTNSELWDRYFMSGLHLDGKHDENSGDAALKEAEEKMRQFVDSSEANPLANTRISLAPSAQSLDREKLNKQLTHYRWMARNLMLDGGFNINSTRKEAWKAWLTSAKNKMIAQVDPVTGAVSESSSGGSVFSRLPIPAGGANEEWHGYVEISDSDIDSLAEKIVEQVKLRGPFLSVGDFVNRRLTKDDTGKSGVIEASLEAALSQGLLGSGNERGVTGKLRQSDILATSGDVLVARSDTFVIRAYGESVDAASGRVMAQSWCEAVVQRMPIPVGDTGVLLDAPNPDYIGGKDPGGIDAYKENPAASELSKKYGRQFKIVSFRWLNKDEV